MDIMVARHYEWYFESKDNKLGLRDCIPDMENRLAEIIHNQIEILKIRQKKERLIIKYNEPSYQRNILQSIREFFFRI